MTKQNSTKSALLLSALSLLMCASMFIGSTFAWFTDSVTSSGNKIQAGTLNIDLELLDKENGWTSIKESKAPVFNYNLWEPGFTEVKVLKIENEGSLALKWHAKFVSDSELSKLANVIDVYVCPSATELTYPSDRNLDGYTKVGTVTEFVNKIEETTKGTLAPSEVAYLGIALKMQESAGNEYQGLTLGTFDIMVLATQDSVENDSFDNQYDVNAETANNQMVVNTVEELNDAINNAKEGAVISVEPGVYEIGNVPVGYSTRSRTVEQNTTDSPIVITENNITIKAQDSEAKPVFKFITSDSGSISHGIEIKSSNVTLENLILQADPSGDCSGNLVQISANNNYHSDITIDGCEFIGSDHSIAMYGNNVTIKNCIFDESTAPQQGNIIYVWGTSGELTIQDNVFIGNNQRKHGISFYYQSAVSKISGNIVIQGNTFTDVYKGIVHESNMEYNNVKVDISNNKFENCKKEPVAIDQGIYESYEVNHNVFININDDNNLIDNSANAIVNADYNYWDGHNPFSDDIKVFAQNVTVNNYYSDEALQNLINK